MPKFINLTGQKIGRLSVIKLAEKGPRAWWICICDCGTIKTISSSLLRSGQITSCGCYKKENDGKHCIKHGMAAGGKVTPEYNCWRHMKRRCLNPKDGKYDRYGGRGIKICDRWINNFENFLSDMGKRPFAWSEINRIDNDGNYTPENCEWTSKKINNRNRMDNHRIEFNSSNLSIAEWAEKTGISWHTIYYRIFRHKWPIEKALTTPVKSRRSAAARTGLA